MGECERKGIDGEGEEMGSGGKEDTCENEEEEERGNEKIEDKGKEKGERGSQGEARRHWRVRETERRRQSAHLTVNLDERENRLRRIDGISVVRC